MLINYGISGDSFTSIGFNMTKHRPSFDNPLGVEWLGYTSIGATEAGLALKLPTGVDAPASAFQPNWVGYLAKDAAEHALIYDFAYFGT